MDISIDLHAHSGYAGGVGDVSLTSIEKAMQYKGIDIFGTGDCLFPKRMLELKEELVFCKDGLFKLDKNSNANFILQTEVILTTRLKDYKNKILAHHIILFPDFGSVEKLQILMGKWKQKNTIGRPFIATENQNQLIDYLFEIKNINNFIEIIPAHIVTPDGLMGSRNKLSHPYEFYQDFFENIHALETGLSADPGMLCDIEGLSHLTMLSFSDGHSAALNRIGREFTVLDIPRMTYQAVIMGIRENQVKLTAEFMPEEGRYHLTGHRENRPGHTHSVFFNDNTPTDFICPVCMKKMIPGVNDWIKKLPKAKYKSSHNFIHLVPLVDVIANALKIKNSNSKTVLECYRLIIEVFSNEISLWNCSEKDIKLLLTKNIDLNIINAIIKVQNQDFYYNPPGFDGNYGVLKIN